MLCNVRAEAADWERLKPQLADFLGALPLATVAAATVARGRAPRKSASCGLSRSQSAASALTLHSMAARLTSGVRVGSSAASTRSEERRGGEEGRSRGAPDP